ncbi:flagellar biosynthetic protein FliR [Scopulibacillus daqui]|uniref:Flagellar biosynthetic protein FliR n=1 Tax=Scopulibacillus daqui TaxID=1469162 RepID=A0ABS2PXR8_9BACL|nr:flagellar biosynthetic protein FliR [Scopulibacillus daqui]MBM7644370.1 flagellar biosynthetic protein FliR [Scopulibacillus daqui]
MNLFNALPIYLLVLVRLASFFVTMPIFSYRTIPARVKVGLAALLSLIATTTMLHHPPEVAIDTFYLLLIIKESIVGLAIGFVAGLLIYAVQMAGYYIDVQMGLSMANAINPENGVTTPLTGQFLNVLALLLMLALDGHLMLINGILDSFRMIKINELSVPLLQGSTAHFIVNVFLKMAGISFQMAMPILACLFLVDVALGIVARTVPQVNVFVVGFPLKIIVSFALLLMIMPMFFTLFHTIFELMEEAVSIYMQLLGSS